MSSAKFPSEILVLNVKIHGNENQQYSNEYIPGQCNLGIDEINSRKWKSLIGLIVSVLYIIMLYLFHVTNEWRLFLFIPLFYSVICYYQAQRKFCVVFGIKGIFNFEKIGKSTNVTNDLFKLQDRRNAWRIIFISFIFTFIIVAVYFFLPL